LARRAYKNKHFIAILRRETSINVIYVAFFLQLNDNYFLQYETLCDIYIMRENQLPSTLIVETKTMPLQNRRFRSRQGRLHSASVVVRMRTDVNSGVWSNTASLGRQETGVW